VDPDPGEVLDVVEMDKMLALLHRFAATMAETYEVSDVLYELGDSAVTILDADGAGVSVVGSSGRLEFVTATDQSLLELERVQEEFQAGPCVEAFRRGEPVIVRDIADVDEDWPEYKETAARTHFGAVVGMPLTAGARRVGSLNIYQRQAREWSDDDVHAVRSMADIATAYIVRAGELAQARVLAGQLEHALGSRVVIEQAKGVLSREHGISVDAAFDLLRSYSRGEQRSLREVAHDVVHGGLRID